MRRGKVTRVILAAVLCVVVAGCAVALWGYNLCRARYGGTENVRIYIPDGATAESIADTLGANLGTGYAAKVMRLWTMQKGQPGKAHGSYVVKPSTTALDLSRTLRSGRQDGVKVTFNNVRTMRQLAERVTANLELSADEFLVVCDTLLPRLGYKPAEFQAAFLPDTYEFYWTADGEDVVTTLNRYTQRFWNDERLAQASSAGLTPVQAATLASIVEEESAKTDEWPVIARLYRNRLDRGMKLQADPTVKYAIGDFTIRRVTGDMLKYKSPYNTYIAEGLPPGPIRVADRRSIDAVLGAPRHQYLYMCAKEDFSGYHNFATDIDTHHQNARRYHAALNRRGIK